MKNTRVAVVILVLVVIAGCSDPSHDAKSAGPTSPTESFLKFLSCQRAGQYDEAYAMMDAQSRESVRQALIDLMCQATNSDPQFRAKLQAIPTRKLYEALWRSTTYGRTDVISEKIEGNSAVLVVRDYSIDPPVDLYRYLIRSGDSWLVYAPKDAKGFVTPADRDRASARMFAGHDGGGQPDAGAAPESPLQELARRGIPDKEATDSLWERQRSAPVATLVKDLTDRDWTVRNGAAYVLGLDAEMSSPADLAIAVEPLITSLKDENWSVRYSAAGALGSCRDKRAVTSLIAALVDPTPMVRYTAAKALGRLGDGQAVEPLIKALADSEAPVRSSAADALGTLGDKRATNPLNGLLQDPDLTVRQHAAEAISRLGARSPG